MSEKREAMSKKRKTTERDDMSEREEESETRVEELKAREVELEAQEEKLKAREAELKTREEELRRDRERLDLERSAYYGNTRPTDVLKLNIGGTKTTVLRSTLTCVSGSMIASKFSGRWDDSIEKDDEGNFVIDQDISQFGPILNFLRTRALLGDQKSIVPPSLKEHGPNLFRIIEYYGLADSMYPLKLKNVNEITNRNVEISGLKCSVSGQPIDVEDVLTFDTGCQERRVKAIEVKIEPPFDVGLYWYKPNLRYKHNIGLGMKPVGFLFTVDSFKHFFHASEFYPNSSEDVVVRSEDYGRRWYINGKLVEGQNFGDEMGNHVPGKTLQNAIEDSIEKNSASASFSPFVSPHFYVRECKFEVTHYELSYG